MSSKNNVNPGQYKVRGSLRQGEDVVHDRQKKEYKQAAPPDQKHEEDLSLIPEGQPTESSQNKEKAKRKEAK